jgi:membrane fusion protein, multidrug efflux system
MKTYLLYFGFAAMVIAAGCQKKNDLESKKQALVEKQKLLAGLKEEIAVLEKEIEAAGGGKALKVKDVHVAVLAPQLFQHFIDVQGKIDSDKNILVNPQMNGTIEKVYVTAGQQVQKGQLLAQLEAAAILQGLEEVKVQLDFAKTLYDKQKKLWEQKIGTEVQYLSAKNNVNSLERRLATLQQQYNYTRVVAPISGVVDEVKAREGELAVPMMPLFRVVNLSDFKVVAEIAEAHISKVDKGDKVKLHLPDLNKDIEGVVTQKTSFINPVNRTFAVEIGVKGAQVALKPNMIVKVKINDYSSTKALSVPVNTLQSTDEGDFVYIAAKGAKGFVAKQQLVKKGVIYGDRVEITDGLKEGDQLITAGYNDLTEGEIVKF